MRPPLIPRWSNWTLRPRTGVAHLPVCRDTFRISKLRGSVSGWNGRSEGESRPCQGSDVGRRRTIWRRPALCSCSALSGRREGIDRHVISVRISERELLGLSVRIHVWLLFKPGDERTCPLKRQIEIFDAEKQQKAVPGCCNVGTRQRRMLVGSPLVKAEQHRAVGVDELSKVGVARRRRPLSEQRLVPLEAPRHILHPDDGPRALHVSIDLSGRSWPVQGCMFMLVLFKRAGADLRHHKLAWLLEVRIG